MKKVDSLSSSKGRLLIQEVFHELKYQKQLGSFAILLICWRICVYDTEIAKYVKTEVSILHRLGFLRGTKIWMEEIVNRFYFSTINSFVYFGAAILLVLIGVRRFSESMDDSIVIAGVIFEALMLFFMFIVMLFTPGEETPTFSYPEPEDVQKEELLTEIGEIARDFAQSSVLLEILTDEIKKINFNQELLVEKIETLTNSFSQISSPNPEFIGIIKETNISLSEFKNTVQELNKSTELIRKEEVERAVRNEIEKIIFQKVLKSGNE